MRTQFPNPRPIGEPGLVVAFLVALLLTLFLPFSAVAEPRDGDSRTAYLVLVPSGKGEGFDESLLRSFERTPGLSPGLYSATQGSYSRGQSLLDISQGTRVSRSLYDPEATPTVELRGNGSLAGWGAVLRRARTAPQTIEPGLMAGTVPGGAALVLADGVPGGVAVPAADRVGEVSTISIVPPARVARNALARGSKRSLVVVGASPGKAGVRQLRQLVRSVDRQGLVIAIQSPPGGDLLPVFPLAVSGMDADSPTSDTTSLPGMVGAIDFAPTVLDHLGIEIPDEMTGTVIGEGPGRDAAELTSFRDRLDSVGDRRIPAVAGLAVGWLFLFLIAGAIAGPDRIRADVRRTGGLAVLWLPTVTLLTPLVGNPPAWLEVCLIALLSLGLGAASDRLLPWPRATAIPAFFGLATFTIDLALGSPLVIRSVLGPSPGYGARFYGIGNELEAVLVVLLLAGMAGLLAWRPRSWNAAGAVGAAALALAVVLGSGRLGAAVGGVVVVAVAAGVMAVMLMPGRLTPLKVAALVVAPILALALLAGLDLLFAGDQGHFARNVLGEGSGSGFGETVERRLSLAWQQVFRGAMPVALIASLLAIVFGWRNRAAFEPFPGPAWPAAIAGALAGGVIGSIVEDSGPLLLVSSVLVLLGLAYYLLGRPEGASAPPATEEESVTG